MNNLVQKRIIILPLVILFGGMSVKANHIDDKYEKLWAEVSTFENKALPKSALEKVEEIYALALKEQNDVQIVKATIYRLKYKSTLEEDGYENGIKKLESEILQTSGASKPILHLYLAKMYTNYYQVNSYLINQRSVSYNFEQNDIKTWDKTKFQDKIIKNYFLALDISLKNENLSNYSELIDNADLSKPRFENLYDFVAYSAIKALSSQPFSYYSYDNFYNDDKFDDKSLFLDAENFVNYKFDFDSLSYNYNVLRIYQEWLKAKFENKENLASLLMVDIDRLDFVRKNYKGEQGDELYLEKLENLHDIYLDKPELTYISYNLANYYGSNASQYDFSNPLTLKFKDYSSKAISIIDEALNLYPKSHYSSECENLKIEIQKESVSFNISKVVCSSDNFPIRISYKNIDKLYLTIVSLKYEDYLSLNFNYDRKEYFKKLLKFSTFKVNAKEINLPKTSDYNLHFTNYIVDGLDKGFYVLILHAKPEIQFEENLISNNSIFVSDLVLTRMEDNQYNNPFYVLNRKTGQAVSGAKINVYQNEYSYAKRGYVNNLITSAVSDKNGMVFLPKLGKKTYYDLRFDILKDKDFISEKAYCRNRYFEEEESQVEVKLFTDRAIYRPGQTVFYKGICVEKKTENIKPLPNYSTNLFIYDDNYQELESKIVKTNEFGSFSGSFNIPLDVLTGDFSIHTNDGDVYFKVEEYKRPNFEIEILPIEGEYRINDEISVSGKAMTYAGTALTDAQLKYRIVRNPIWRIDTYKLDFLEKEIAYGDARINDEGKFEFSFKALAENDSKLNEYLYYNYSVFISVTDINGETQQTSTSVYVSNKALNISHDFPKKIVKEDIDSIKIYSSNVSGRFVPAQVNIEIFKLKDPKLLLAENQLEAIDMPLYSKEEWFSKLPGLEFEDETNFENWEVEKSVFKSKVNTENTKSLKINSADKWQAGVYRIVLKSKDKWGNEIIKTDNVVVVSKNSKQMPYTNTEFFQIDKTTALPGETVNLFIGSSYKNVDVLYSIVKKNKYSPPIKLKLDSELVKIAIPITEDCRGGFSISVMFIKDNRIYTYSRSIIVPWQNKNIDIKFTSFRDKTQPGAKENWTLKLVDEFGNPVQAEFLASMYDASLDVFAANSWSWSIYPNYYYYASWLINSFGIQFSNTYEFNFYKRFKANITFYYPELKLFGFYYSNYYGSPVMFKTAVNSGATMNPVAMDVLEATSYMEFEESENSDLEENDIKGKEVQVRKNFNETAFFYPHILSDANGELSLSFTVPESLTRWKFMGFAHTKDMKFGDISEEIVCQKELMIMPNYPRFFREGDSIILSSKINNVSEQNIKGKAKIEIFDPLSLKIINSEFLTENNNIIDFNVEAGKNTSVSWSIFVSNKYEMIGIRLIAEGKDHSDGEERIFPIISNQMLVTETMPLPVRKAGVSKFNFNSLKNNNSTTLRNQAFTLEFTSNPAWYAVQALPYIMEYPYECAEQTFSRLYANMLASHIANSNPKIKRVFDMWQNLPDSQALYSNLEKNQELKALLIEETPWVLQAKDETIRKKQLGLLFDLNKMNYESNSALKKLLDQQLYNGGWAWFKGMPESWYISQHIVAGFGHLDKLGVIDIKTDKKIWEMISKAVGFIDKEIVIQYKEMKKYCNDDCLKNDQLSYMQAHYLYARSYFINDIPIPKESKEVFEYYKNQAEKYWTNKSFYTQGMLALALNRYGETKIANNIIASLKEHAQHSDEMGMYWKNEKGSYWYLAPIETQALFIEVFNEVAHDLESVKEMRVWLLKQKQTQDWKTTKATSEAIYALLLGGSDILSEDEEIKINIGDLIIEPANDDEIKTEAGTGYFKKSWDGTFIKPDWANISVEKTKNTVSWGAVYWQYFEQLDKIKGFEDTPLKINKELFVERRQGEKLVIIPIEKDANLKLGDKVKVRIEIRVDREMEYVHLKDMRASCFEPVDYLSGYRYKSGLGYYQAIKDASMNFFIDYLPKGTYVFEYDLIVSQRGDFSNGITSIQSMYAPEFTSHSEGVRVKVE